MSSIPMGRITSNRSMPRKRYASRQESSTRKIEVAGTRIMAPKEPAPLTSPSVRPRLVTNHWLTILVNIGPVPRVTPTLIMENRMYSCQSESTRGISASIHPMTMTPDRATHLGL